MTANSDAQGSAPIDQRLHDAQVRKAVAEAALVEKQLQQKISPLESLRSLAPLGGAITALVAVLTLYFSVSKGLDEIRQGRESRLAERTDSAFRLLSDDSVATKLSAVSTLRTFLRTPDTSDLLHAQVLSALAHALSVERDPRTRSAIVDALSGVDPATVSVQARNVALDTLSGLSRSLVQELRLGHEGRYPWTAPAPGSEEAVVGSLGKAIAAIARTQTTHTDFSGIYCPQCDFTKLRLAKANFRAAILPLAKFDESVADGADFTDANLESSSFVRSSLRGAKFRVTADLWETVTRPTNQAWQRLPSNFDLRELESPNFSCADLRDADFTNRPIVGFAHLGARPVQKQSLFRLYTPRFNRANLANANFSSMSFLYANQTSAFALNYSEVDGVSLTTFRFGEGTVQQLFLTPESDFPDLRQVNLFPLRDTLFQSNWEEAKFPKGVLRYLVRNNPEEDDGAPWNWRNDEIGCEPLAPAPSIATKRSRTR